MKIVLPFTHAICYSGFRDGQSPELGVFPTYEQIREDLLILAPHWQSLRLYDCDEHAETVLQVIQDEGLEFDIMLGAYILAEMNNPKCPWGAEYSNSELAINHKLNQKRITRLVELANAHPEIITSVSIGNEASVEWTDHLVSLQSLLGYAKHVRANVSQPVTFCENYVPWLEALKPLGQELDFIAMHTYPVWEYKSIHEALNYTIENYEAVAQQYPDKQIVITEAGWATQSNGRGIHPDNVDEVIQRTYIKQLQEWARKNGILVFLFEAFDENWKGSDDPKEPEKHWGLYRVDRTPKLIMRDLAHTKVI